MNRKRFIRILFGSAFLPVLYFWDSIVQKKIRNESGKSPIVLKNEFPAGITFHDSVIVNNTGKGLEVFSSKCSHLGCRINAVEKNEIVCPCHGSRYSFDGNVLKGPSTKALTKLEFQIDSKNGNVIIYPA